MAAKTATRKRKTKIKSFADLQGDAAMDYRGIGHPHAEMVVKDDIPNPLYNPRYEGYAGNPKHITAAMNVRESAIVTLRHRGHITEAQELAANRFRSLWEALGGSGAGSFDYSREPVDGGGSRDPLTERQVNAGIELARCQSILGVRAYAIMSKVAGEGYAIGDLAASQRERKTASDYLKDGLDELAVHWGYQKAVDARKIA